MSRRTRKALALLVLFVGSATLAGAQAPTTTRWFEVEGIEAGAGDPPPELDRSTPRQTISQLLLLGHRERYREAAHLLDLRDLSEAERAERGPDLARKLVEVIDRTTVIDWTQLPARPDARQTTAPGDGNGLGPPRRSLQLNVLELERRPAELRVSRLKPAEGDAVWLVSSQTVRDIDALYDRYGPGWLDEHLPDWLRHDAVLGTRVWEWVVLPLALAFWLALGWGIHRLLGFVAARVRPMSIRSGADRVRLPLTVALVALTARATLGTLFSVTGFFHNLLNPLLVGLIIIGFTMAVLRAIDAVLEVVTERYVDEIDDSKDSDRRHLFTSIYALRRLVILAAVLVSAVLLLVELHAFESIGLSLLASAGVLTVLFGIAGQTVLGNILASLQIAIAKPVRIGDAVEYENQWAYVESIFFTFIVLRTWDGRRQIVPVQYFVSNPFENWSMVDASITRKIVFRLDHRARPAELRERFEALVADDERALTDRLLKTAVTDHDEWFQEITFFATAANPSDAWLMQLDLREALADWIRAEHPDWWPRQRLLGDDENRRAGPDG